MRPRTISDVCKVSVYTIVLTPPSNVYSRIINNTTAARNPEWDMHILKDEYMQILMTRYKRAVAPTVRDNIKKDAPVLYAHFRNAATGNYKSRSGSTGNTMGAKHSHHQVSEQVSDDHLKITKRIGKCPSLPILPTPGNTTK